MDKAEDGSGVLRSPILKTHMERGAPTSGASTAPLVARDAPKSRNDPLEALEFRLRQMNQGIYLRDIEDRSNGLWLK